MFTYRHKRPLKTVGGLGHQRLVFARLLVAVSLQHEPTTGVVQLLVSTFTTDYLVFRRAARLIVSVIATQRRQGIPDIRFVWFGMRCHPESSTGPDAVSVSHATHPLSLKRPLKSKYPNELLSSHENCRIVIKHIVGTRVKKNNVK